ncbi:MAG: ABC transporter permease, partial [Gemmatimonadota bacterium]|nr:ABC transporter permease [Gemmatimonadota bacterium]
LESLKTSARQGRLLAPSDESEDNRLVVLSQGLWERQFGSDPGVVGSVISLNHSPFTVVGVAEARFAFPSEAADAWTFISTIPQSSIPTERRFVRFASGLARLEPGVTPADLRAELAAVAAGLESRFPETNTGIRDAKVEPLQDVMVGNVSTGLWILMGAVGFILLIACVNVAALILTRAAERDGEMAVRSPLGARRAQLAKQLLVEGGILATTGAALGILAAHVGVRFFMDRSAGILPRATNVGVDFTVLGFTVALVALTALVFGLVPALGASRVDISSTLREGGRDRGTTRLGRTLPRLLIATEVALSLTLLVGAALLLRSLGNLRNVDPGFEPASALAITFTVSTERHPDLQASNQAYLDRVRALPGVTAAGSIRTLPLSGDGERWPFSVPGVFEPAVGEEPVEDVRLTGLNEPPQPTTYVSLELVGRAAMSVVVRTDEDMSPVALIESLRLALAEVDPRQPISRVETLEQAMSVAMARPRFFTLVLALFSIVASTLAAVGVYGVISYYVGQRKAERGLRMALGAGTGTVVRSALTIGMVPALAGAGVGLVLAGILSRTLDSLLFGVESLDPVTYGVVAAAAVSVAFLACWVPARRAGRVDPAVTLTSWNVPRGLVTSMVQDAGQPGRLNTRR